MQVRPVEVEQPYSQSVLPGSELREAGTGPLGRCPHVAKDWLSLRWCLQARAKRDE